MSNAEAFILYRVSNIGDFNLPTWNIGNPAVTASQDLCVYTTLLGNYSITISSPGGFVLKSGSNQIPYSLKWDSSGAGNLGSGGTQLSNNVALGSQPNSNILASDCSLGTPAGPTARLTITIAQADMIAALAGTYTGTITLIVGP